MANTERGTENGPKYVNYHNLLITRVLNLGILRGVPPYKFNRSVTTVKETGNGTILKRIEPFLLSTAKQEDLNLGSRNEFLLHNPHDETEKYSYFISLGQRDWGDGEATNHIVISKILSPHKFRNKKSWIEMTVDKTLSPFTSEEEFESKDVDVPTILISMYEQSLSISYKGGLDRFLGEIYSFFPDKEGKLTTT